MIDISKYERLTIDDWYKMNHHDWKDVVNEYNDLLAEVKQLRKQLVAYMDFLNWVAEEHNDVWDEYEGSDEL